MKAARTILAPAVLLSAVLTVPCNAEDTENAGATPMLPALRGPLAVDAYPGACVDCHVSHPERGIDARLSARLAKWTRGEVDPRLFEQARASAPAGAAIEGRHPESTDSLDDIPGACLECHSDDARRAPSFARLIHLVHLGGGAQNHFMTEFGGECTLCHKLDVRNGQWSVPSRPERR